MTSPKKNNALFIVTKSEPGGAQKFVYEQILIMKNDFNLFLATDSYGWLYTETSNLLGGTLINSKIKSISILYIFILIKYIKKNKIDLIICNSANGGFYGRIAALLSNRKVVYVSHGWSSTYKNKKLSPIFNKIEWLLSKISTSILCISEHDKSIAINKIGVKASLIKVIHNSIFPFTNNPTPKTNDNVTKILTVARLDYPKRLDLLIDSLGNFENVEVYIVGGGPQESLLKSLVKEKSLTNIFLLGTISGFNKFAEYDIFILLSNSEGLPMSALEAMSCGLPLILSDVGGCNELLRNNGVLVKNEVLEIRQALVKCIDKKEQFKTESVNLFNENFNMHLNKSEYIAYYQYVMKANFTSSK